MNEKYLVIKKSIDKGNSFLIENAPLNYLYGKEIFFSTGHNDRKYLLYQMVGNLGAFANDYDFDNSISVCVISDSLIDRKDNGQNDDGLDYIERKLALKTEASRDLLVVSESALINFIQKRNSTYTDAVTSSLTDAYLSMKFNIISNKMNKEELRSEYLRLSQLHSIEDCLDLFDIYLEYLWNTININHYDEVYSLADKDAKIMNQMMFSKLTHLKKIVEGVGYQSRDGSKLNPIIDPTIVASLVRNIYETVSIFNLIFRNPKSEDEKAITYGLWVASGLNYRQRFGSKASLPENIEKLTEEKKQIDQITKELTETNLYKSLDDKNKGKIVEKLKQKDYKIKFNGIDVVFLNWQDMCDVMDLNKDLFEHMYSYFSLYSHPSHVAVFQFENMFDPKDEAFKFLTTSNLKLCFSLVSVFIADYINLFPSVKITFEKLEIEKQIAINALNKLIRGDKYSINDAWTI
jgi:hypothetical protein